MRDSERRHQRGNMNSWRDFQVSGCGVWLGRRTTHPDRCKVARATWHHGSIARTDNASKDQSLAKPVIMKSESSQNVLDVAEKPNFGSRAQIATPAHSRCGVSQSQSKERNILFVINVVTFHSWSIVTPCPVVSCTQFFCFTKPPTSGRPLRSDG